jgi:predicted Zn finger-like uncharacterized protein
MLRMRLSCPNCQTEYNVPDAALVGRTRTLRCVNCGTQWQAGPIDADIAETAPAPAPSPLPALAEPPQTLPSAGYQELVNFTPPPAMPSRPPRETREPIDPAEARSIADRESFAALLESSRQQAVSQTQDDAPAEPKKRRIKPLLISILAVLIIIGLIIIERNAIMAAWPPSIRLFEGLGLK